jgi:hypothetical protein
VVSVVLKVIVVADLDFYPSIDWIMLILLKIDEEFTFAR